MKEEKLSCSHQVEPRIVVPKETFEEGGTQDYEDDIKQFCLFFAYICFLLFLFNTTAKIFPRSMLLLCFYSNCSIHVYLRLFII